QPDAYTVLAGSRLLAGATAPAPLANDTDADGDALSATLVAGPGHGVLVLQADGSFAYKPDAGFLGADSFTYRPGDGVTLGAATTVTVDVIGLPPVAAPDAYAAAAGTPLVVNAGSGVLANDVTTYPAPLTAQLLSGPAHGTLQFSSDGS